MHNIHSEETELSFWEMSDSDLENNLIVCKLPKWSMQSKADHLVFKKGVHILCMQTSSKRQAVHSLAE